MVDSGLAVNEARSQAHEEGATLNDMGEGGNLLNADQFHQRLRRRALLLVTIIVGANA